MIIADVADYVQVPLNNPVYRKLRRDGVMTGVPALAAAPPMFVENTGRFAPAARLVMAGAGSDLWLAEDGLWLRVGGARPAERAWVVPSEIATAGAPAPAEGA